MKVTLLKPVAGETIFLRKLDSDATMAAVTHFAMTQDTGAEYEILVENKGFSLSFKTGSFSVEELVRKTEGIIVRKPRAEKTEAAT